MYERHLTELYFSRVTCLLLFIIHEHHVNVVAAADVCVQVYSVVDEMFLAGEIRETSQTKVLKQLLMLSSLE